MQNVRSPDEYTRALAAETLTLEHKPKAEG
jgi:hypothetical protein